MTAPKQLKSRSKTPRQAKPKVTKKKDLVPVALMPLPFRAALIDMLQEELSMKKARGYVQTLEQLPVKEMEVDPNAVQK